jgi:hypothetical protein
MKTYEFTITLSATAADADTAWEQALEAFAMDPGTVPEDYTEEDCPDEDDD